MTALKTFELSSLDDITLEYNIWILQDQCKVVVVLSILWQKKTFLFKIFVNYSLKLG